MLLICRLKFSLWSNCKSRWHNRCTGHINLICWLLAVIRSSVWTLSNIIASNLPRFTSIFFLFFLKQSMTTSDSDSNNLINLETVLANADRVSANSNYKEMLEPQKRKGHSWMGWKESAPIWIPVKHLKLYSWASCVCCLYGRTEFDLSGRNKDKTKLNH